jgi:hypothetical protein
MLVQVCLKVLLYNEGIGKRLLKSRFQCSLNITQGSIPIIQSVFLALHAKKYLPRDSIAGGVSSTPFGGMET